MSMAKQYDGPPEGEDFSEAQIAAKAVIGAFFVLIVIILAALFMGGGW
jgi:hypothetical protein